MFKPAALFIGLRYTRAKRRNHFVSFISIVSIVGIALGVMALITVLSVMNGFDREIKKRVFSMVPAMTVSSVEGYVANWQDVQKILNEFPEVTASAPFVTGEVLLNYSGATLPALVTGILPDQEKHMSQLADKMVKGKLTDLQPGKFGIVLGENLAARLFATIGDKVTVMTPQVSMTPVGIMPRFKQFTVVGIFNTGGGFGFDLGLGYIHLQDAQKLFGLRANVTGIHLNIKDVFAAPKVAQHITSELTGGASVTTWADQFGEFFHIVKQEKVMMFFILLLIIIVAVFNLVSTLMMVVNEKESDIAILRTFGATPRMIMLIFIVQGGIIGLFGTLIGVICGLLLAFNVTDIFYWLQGLLHIQFMSSNVYFINYLPSYIEWQDIVAISIMSLLLSLIATIFPAWRAAKLDPVESLRYE